MGSTQANKVIDLGPVNVRGALRARYARVIWQSGILYVIHRSAGRVIRQTLQTAEPVRPTQPHGYWRADSDAGMVSFTSKGCGG